LLRFLFGEIVSIRSISSIEEIDNDPTLSCNLEMQNGLFCNLIGLDGRFYRIFDLEIFGSTSKISIDTSKQIRFFKSVASKRSSEFNELYEAIYNNDQTYSKEIFLNTLSNIIGAIENKSKMQSTGLDGYKSIELIIAAKLSFEMKQKIELPLGEDYCNDSI